MGCSQSSASKEDDQQKPFSDMKEKEQQQQQQKQNENRIGAPSGSKTSARGGKYANSSSNGSSSSGPGPSALNLKSFPSAGPSTLLPQMHSDIVFSLCRGPQANSFFSGSEDKGVCLFSSQLVSVKQAKIHDRTVSSMVYHDGRKELFTGSRDKTVKQWSLQNGNGSDELKLQQTFQGHTLPVSAVSVAQSSASDDPISLVSGARDYQLRFWDIERGTCLFWTEINQNVITDVKWIQGEPCVLQASEDLSLRVWDKRTKECVQTFSDGPYFALHADVSQDNNYFLTGHNGFEGVGCEMKLFDRRTGKKVVELQVGRQAVTDAQFMLGPGLRSITSSKDAYVRVWDLEAILAMGAEHALSDTFSEEGCVASLQLDQSESVQSVCCAPMVNSCGQSIATGHVNGRVSIWEVDLQRKTLQLQMLAPGTSE